jgi:hypothetical protein
MARVDQRDRSLEWRNHLTLGSTFWSGNVTLLAIVERSPNIPERHERSLGGVRYGLAGCGTEATVAARESGLWPAWSRD